MKMDYAQGEGDLEQWEMLCITICEIKTPDKGDVLAYDSIAYIKYRRSNRESCDFVFGVQNIGNSNVTECKI